MTTQTSRLALFPAKCGRGLKRTPAFRKQQMVGEFQAEWRWCFKCQGLFFLGNPSQGICPSDGKSHDASKSGKYLVNFGETHPGGSDGFSSTPGQQGGWRWCHKCQGLFFAGDANQGVCPADHHGHDASISGHYSMVLDDGTNCIGQLHWRGCRKCRGLFFSGNPDQGACPAGGTHEAANSGLYQLRRREF